MKTNEEQKNLLLIMPKFFDYPETIIEELNNLGYNVDFFDDRPSTNSFIKALIRVKRKLATPFIKSYFKKIFRIIKSRKYDVVLLISGQSLAFSEEMICKIREVQSQAKFILYQWDSIKNFPYIVKMHKYFDKCFSFDKNDVAEYKNLTFLPLFYSRKYEDIGLSCVKINDYDFCFIGTAHPKKYKFINEMTRQLKEIYPNQFVYFYFPSRLVYFYRKIKNTELKNAKYSEFHFNPLNSDKVNEIFSTSKCVLDSAQEGQVGLTMRVFEALGAKKKIITTNEDIKNYDFYCEENIYVYNGTFDFSSKFFLEPYKSIPADIYKKYSLKRWLLELIK